MQPPTARVECREPTASLKINNTNNFAILDRAEGVQSSKLNRERPLMILNPILYVSALKARASVKITTNRVAHLARLADRVQVSGFKRRTCLIILHRLAVLISSLALLKLELSRENRHCLSR
eukprot:6538368-Pyramimonas_sp.AAC.1